MSSEQLLATAVPLLTLWVPRIVGVLVALVVALWISAWLQGRLTTTLLARNFDKTLSIFFGSLVRWLVIAASVIACLGVFGIETTSFAALIGAAGLAVGLAFQGTLSNFAAGVMLLVFRPFKVGDYVVAGGKEGVVAEISLFVTALDTLDNRRIYVPNTAIGAGPIENFTEHPVRRVDIDVNIGAGQDLDATRAALQAAGDSVPGQDPQRPASVFLKGFNPGQVSWQVRVWCAPADYWDVWQATVRAVAYELPKTKIEMPTPAVNVSVKGLHPRAAELFDSAANGASPRS